MKEAVDPAIIDGLTIRNAAERKGLARNNLHTYVKKQKITGCHRLCSGILKDQLS